MFLQVYIVPHLIYAPGKFFMRLFTSIWSIICYMLFMPMYTLVFQIFSYANWQDISWGNRGKSEDTLVNGAI
jgi:cellulose synthase/poly-beta-1,6-N-acetylglucosamine synthase-like glycosyltransferase